MDQSRYFLAIRAPLDWTLYVVDEPERAFEKELAERCPHHRIYCYSEREAALEATVSLLNKEVAEVNEDFKKHNPGMHLPHSLYERDEIRITPAFLYRSQPTRLSRLYCDWVAAAFALFFFSLMIPVPEWQVLVNKMPKWLEFVALMGGAIALIYLFFRATTGFRSDYTDTGYHEH